MLAGQLLRTSSYETWLKSSLSLYSKSFSGKPKIEDEDEIVTFPIRLIEAALAGLKDAPMKLI